MLSLPGSYDKEVQNSGASSSIANNSVTAEEHTLVSEPDVSQIAPSEDEDELKKVQLRDERVGELARQFTRQSTFSNNDISPFNAPKDSPLDPNSVNFNARAWAKALLDLSARDPDRTPSRTSGVAFKNLSVHGFGSDTDFQKTVGNLPWTVYGIAKQVLGLGQRKIQILDRFAGLLNSGDMLVVLGPPGSGCSTLLKTLAGETHGIYVDKDSYINYKGISAKQMYSDFRGEAIYTAEVDVHFPNLSVGDTLEFAARARAPRNPPGGVHPHVFAKHYRDVMMAMFGISHTINTRVGNDFVRGVSGGERKRVTIAEAALSGAPFQCWDNSTRGLDSANAIEFCKTLRTSTELAGTVSTVAIYQAPQSAYDIFNKVTVLYEGRQIYFGPANEAKQFFIDMGYHCPDRQTTADFLTSLTSPDERIVRQGFEGKVPQTPDEFAAAWRESDDYAKLMVAIDQYEKNYPIGGEYLDKFLQSRRAQQARFTRPSSPYTLSYWGQVMLCLRRGFQRLKGDPSLTITQIVGNSIMALIISSIFYNLKMTTASFYQRGALLFFAVILNAFGSALEMLVLYAQRSIVEKHTRYAFYHPSAEAFASMLTDMPYKIVNAICFNLIIYFMSHLRREPGPFFFFLLMSFFITLTMSMLFRTIASVSRTLAQALAPAAILILGLVIYTGFAIPTKYMLGWSRWINYINPIAYGFESLMVNEFHDREYLCSSLVPSGPGYENVAANNQVCATTGSVAGSSYVNGDSYLLSSFDYKNSHKWRNFGIVIAFMFFFMACYLVATEYITEKKSKGEVLVFRKGHRPKHFKHVASDNEAAGGISAGRTIKEKPMKNADSKKTVDAANMLQRQTAIFHWQDVCYDIKIKGNPRRILDHVDGWVKPGTLTALMGVSGAGKTTLLDVLATRVTMGVVTGEMLVDGRLRDASFQRKTGYVQQQDLHLSTSTVREALVFSAVLRQPAHVPLMEKKDYAEQVIKLLEMEDYADAVVGVPGEGLNVEQRKRLTIGVELAAKPQLLLFLDEPTSGLDSQTSWAICDLMEKLMKNGQAILCTIHQPSAMLFQRFDRLLFLAAGGKTVYFGEVGENSSILTNYFEKNGASPCPPDANPAEWMLEVIGAAPGSHTDIDWHDVWNKSAEKTEVRRELASMKQGLPKITSAPSNKKEDKASYREFAAPFGVQLWMVLQRVFEQYWRTPSYIYSKIALCITSPLFIGFSFYKADNSIQGLQNQMYAVFMIFIIFGQITNQILPHFVTQRALYEARERPSKAYSWQAFLLSNIVVELPWNSFAGLLAFLCWYYPIGLYRNAEETDAVHLRGGQMFLFIWMFLLFTSTFSHMTIAGMNSAEEAGNVGNLLFSLTLIFNGVLATTDQMPRFWIWMNKVSPFTYFCDGILSTGVANTFVTCASNEFLHFNPPSGQTCGEYMATYLQAAGQGYLQDSNSTSDCSFCSISSTNAFLSTYNYSYSHTWRNYGILWVYVIFNVFMAVFLYWLARVPKKVQAKEKPSHESPDEMPKTELEK